MIEQSIVLLETHLWGSCRTHKIEDLNPNSEASIYVHNITKFLAEVRATSYFITDNISNVFNFELFIQTEHNQ